MSQYGNISDNATDDDYDDVLLTMLVNETTERQILDDDEVELDITLRVHFELDELVEAD